jgi:hypothetical protein
MCAGSCRPKHYVERQARKESNGVGELYNSIGLEYSATSWLLEDGDIVGPRGYS